MSDKKLQRALASEEEGKGGKQCSGGAEHDEQRPERADHRALAIIVTELRCEGGVGQGKD